MSAEGCRGRRDPGGVASEVDALTPTAVRCWRAEGRGASGDAWAGAAAEGIRPVRPESLRWLSDSPRAGRGFGAGCGGFEFPEANASPVRVALAAIDGMSGVRIDPRIEAAEAKPGGASGGLPAFDHGRDG